MMLAATACQRQPDGARARLSGSMREDGDELLRRSAVETVMTEPYMVKTNGLLKASQKAVVKLPRHRWRRIAQGLVCVFLVGLFSLTLTGCSDFWGEVGDLFRIGGGGNAEAQDATERRVETFVIETDGFQIRLDNDADTTPTLDGVFDSATQLKMASAGTMVLGTGSSIPLELGDVVILRLNGETGSATLIRAK